MVQSITSSTGSLPLQAEPTAVETDLRPKVVARPAPAAESVLLSAEASALPSALQSGPPMDVDRISRLREAIEEGNYQPDPRKIADSLTQNIVELSG